MASFIIALDQLRFFANHGVYEEEQLIGNEFEVNLSMEVEAPKEKLTSIENTINYAEVYQATKDVFSKMEPLLETIAMSIAEAIKTRFPTLKKISVQIIKLHPPITSFTGSVSVTYQKKYKD